MNKHNPGKVLYTRGRDELKRQTERAANLAQAFNRCEVDEDQKKEAIIRELFGSVGEGVALEDNFHCYLG
jgi:maltose O-acetyltransferase